MNEEDVINVVDFELVSEHSKLSQVIANSSEAE